VSEEEEWQVCAVCGYPLARHTTSEGEFLGWRHGPGDVADHIAVPVSARDIDFKQKCDFCSEEPVVWEIVAKSFEMLPETSVTPAQMSLGGWGACSDCGDLIRTDKWSALISRVRAKSQWGPTRPMLTYLYGRLQINIIEILPYDEWRARQSYPLPNE
jgi:hypothetical protein